MLVPRAARRGLKFVWRFSRFVGAACMRPANLAGVGRCRVGMVCTLHCRAGVHARRTYYKNLKNYRCGGVKTPPYRAAETVMLPINPAWGAPLPGGIYASPTNTRGRVHEPKTLPWGERPRRGLRPQARFGAQPGRKARLLAHRSRSRPTEQGKNVPCPAKTCIFMQERAPAAPRPVRIAKKPPKSPLPLCALPLAFWQKCCIIYNIE